MSLNLSNHPSALWGADQKAAGIQCLASTTQRMTVEQDGVKTSVFKFLKFRKYTCP